MNRLLTTNFDLKKTLECGQFFQFEHFGNGYVVFHDKLLFYVEQQHDWLFYDGVSESKLKSLFSLDEDYNRIINELKKDKPLAKPISFGYGLRIMKQNFFDCLVAYVCSANSSIPKIKKNVRSIAVAFGKRKRFKGKDYWLFPEQGSLSDYDKLLSTGLGFRARYLFEIDKSIDKDIEYKLAHIGYPQAREMLISLPGIGPKIADCVCLFSLHMLNAFPVDVWISRAISSIYFNNRKMSKTKIRDFSVERFGEFAGYANQFLFYYFRSMKTNKF